MASWRDLFGGEYLNLDKVGSKTITDTIKEIGLSTGEAGMFAKGKKRPYAMLVKEKKRVSINMESCELLAEKFGDEMEEWVGKKIKIKAGTVIGPKGKPVDALIVSPA